MKMVYWQQRGMSKNWHPRNLESVLKLANRPSSASCSDAQDGDAECDDAADAGDTDGDPIPRNRTGIIVFFAKE